jgi:hypothetical protein
LAVESFVGLLYGHLSRENQGNPKKAKEMKPSIDGHFTKKEASQTTG